MGTMQELKGDLFSQAKKPEEKAVAKAAPKKAGTIFDLIKTMTPGIRQALPKHLDADRLARIATTEVRKNPKLLECSKESFLGALMTAAQLGLEPGPLGQCYLIPYRNSKLGTTECQFQTGYKGLIDLFYRSDRAEVLFAEKACENDEFEFQYGLEPKLFHRPCSCDRGKVRYYYAVAKMKGAQAFVVMSPAEIEDYRARSKSPGNGPWITDYDAMAKKTAIKRLMSYLPLSPEVQRAAAYDGKVATVKETGEIDIDNDLLLNPEDVSVVSGGAE